MKQTKNNSYIKHQLKTPTLQKKRSLTYKNNIYANTRIYGTFQNGDMNSNGIGLL